MISCPLCQTRIPKKPSFLYQHGKDYYLCSHCDLLFLDPENYLSIEDEKMRYLHHENSERDESYRKYISEGVQFAAKYVIPKGRILDFGSGVTQVASELFHQLGFTAESYDPFFYPKLPVGCFDGLFACEVVEHFRNPRRSFDQMGNLISKNGFLIMRTMLHFKELDFKNWWYLRDATHVVFYSMKTIEWLCQRYQFKLESQEKHFLCLKKI